MCARSCKSHSAAWHNDHNFEILGDNLLLQGIMPHRQAECKIKAGHISSDQLLHANQKVGNRYAGGRPLKYVSHSEQWHFCVQSQLYWLTLIMRLLADLFG